MKEEEEAKSFQRTRSESLKHTEIDTEIVTKHSDVFLRRT